MNTMQSPPLLLLLLLPTLATPLQYLWHISDVHVDDLYVATGEPGTFCHSDAGRPERWFGQRQCGLPWRTVQSAVDEMRDTLAGAEAVLWTGDTAPHWPYTDWRPVFPSMRRVAAMLRSAFPDAQIVPAIGNHDAWPSDQLPGDNDTFYGEYLQRSGWAELLPEPARATFRRGGYYSLVAHGIRYIVLNTVLYYNKNQLARDSGSDPGGQLAWLERELTERPDHATIVVAHISPGFPHWSTAATDLRPEQNRRLIELLSRPDTLHARIANVFGHEHIDTFKNVYRADITIDQHTSALNTYFVAPSLIPGTLAQDVNPSVRAYAVLGGKLNDYIQFHFDIQAANAAHRADASVSGARFWNVTYRMREAYGLPDLTTTSMHLLFEQMRVDRSQFDKYWRFTGGLHDNVPQCNDTCRAQHLCTIQAQTHDSMEKCLNGGAHAFASLALVLLVAVAVRFTV